ncbi:MAG: hypothetical protein IJK47_00855 [Lachnospiraceae bacterium]|nr:hypothetical protein [Lachnospiraceae bacterium]
MFRYTVTKDDFTEMTVYLMKQKSAKLSSKIKLVLFTVVQMAVIAYLIVIGKNVSPILRVLMGVFSLLWAGQTVFTYGFYKARARMMLTNQADSDKSGDFWKEHRLQLQGDKVNITYGDKKASVECAQITGTQETENLLLLMSGNGIFELVPKTVAEKQDFRDFLAGIRKTAADKLKAAQEKQRAGALENASFKECLPLSEDEVVTELVRMKRLSMLTTTGWTRVSVLVMIIPLIILALGIVARSVLYIIVAVIFFLLLNAGTLMIFTPLYKKVVRKQVQPAGEGGYLLTVADGFINLFTREYQFRYKIAELRRAMEGKDGTLFLFFPDQQMVFVPSSVSAEFKKAVNKRRSLTEITQNHEKKESEK